MTKTRYLTVTTKISAPEHERQDAVQISRHLGVLSFSRMQTLLQRIKRTGADIAEDHPQRTENQCGDAGGLSMVIYRDFRGWMCLSVVYEMLRGHQGAFPGGSSVRENDFIINRRT